MSEHPTSDDRFQPGSWMEIDRTSGWSPGSRSELRRIASSDIEILKECIRLDDKLKALKRLMDETKPTGPRR
jgi:hypothetical protein